MLEAIKQELEVIWAAHRAVGLEGYMRLYSNPSQEPMKTKEEGVQVWFGPDGIDAALEQLSTHYNNGALPNSPLLLDPFVYTQGADGQPKAAGSGIIWSFSPLLGIADMTPDQKERIETIGGFADYVHRGVNKKAGLKILAFSNKALPPIEGQAVVSGCQALYEVANVEAEEYHQFYPLSGLSYLTKNGAFESPSFAGLFPEGKLLDEAFIKAHQVEVQTLLDAAECWNAYDRHHTLFRRFGVDVPNLERNLKFFNMCARDFELFDRTGPQRQGSDQTFEFLVPGWIPKGAVTLIAATGGTGKSSLAHYLAILASIDWREDEQPPLWLGQPLNTKHAKGVCVYFSGEDGPAIVNARAKLYDPEGRAQRLMFQRTDFGEGVGLKQFFKRLNNMPDVSLMVIDPVRKYLTGDEDDSQVVSEFFEAIEEFAITRGTPMLVVHHLVKGAKPDCALDMLDMLRGSQVFIDRPRVVIGMYREGPYTWAGLSKNNIPPNLGMVQGERAYARDPKTLTLIPIAGEKGSRFANLSDEELEALRGGAE